MTKVHQMIADAKVKHQKDMQSAKMGSCVYYYVQRMIKRADEALLIKDEKLSYRHFIG